MAKRAKDKTANGLDPDVWAELAAWGVVDPGRRQSSEEAALALLARAADMVTDLAAGAPVTVEAAILWIDDVTEAAVTHGWFADSEEASSGAEA